MTLVVRDIVLHIILQYTGFFEIFISNSFIYTRVWALFMTIDTLFMTKITMIMTNISLLMTKVTLLKTKITIIMTIIILIMTKIALIIINTLVTINMHRLAKSKTLSL